MDIRKNEQQTDKLLVKFYHRCNRENPEISIIENEPGKQAIEKPGVYAVQRICHDGCKM
jgi:hypothetical protein